MVLTKVIAIYPNSLSSPFPHPCHSLFSVGIICGPHRGSFPVRDYLRSNLGIICGPGSFAVRDHLRSGIICGPGIIWGPVQIGHCSLPTNWAVTEMRYFVIQFWFYRTFILVWFCEPSHDSINIDTVTLYLNLFTSLVIVSGNTVFQSCRSFTRMLFVPFKAF